MNWTDSIYILKLMAFDANSCNTKSDGWQNTKISSSFSKVGFKFTVKEFAS